MRGKRIEGVEDPVDESDAVNLRSLEAETAAREDVDAGLLAFAESNSNAIGAIQEDYIPQSEKQRFVVDSLEANAIGPHENSPGVINLYGTLRCPFGPIFDLGEPTNPWRDLYANTATLSNRESLKFTHFRGEEASYHLGDLIESGLETLTETYQDQGLLIDNPLDLRFNSLLGSNVVDLIDNKISGLSFANIAGDLEYGRLLNAPIQQDLSSYVTYDILFANLDDNLKWEVLGGSQAGVSLSNFGGGLGWDR